MNRKARLIRKHWKLLRTLLTGGLLLLAIGMIEQGSGHFAPAPVRKAAPTFTLTDLAGVSTSLAQFRGRPVLVNFWATWCPPCRAELPDLEALSQAAPHCLQVLGVSEDSGSPSAVATFAQSHHLTYPIVLDEGAVGGLYGVRTIPQSVLLDAEGRTLGTFEGPISPDAVTHALEQADAPNAC